MENSEEDRKNDLPKYRVDGYTTSLLDESRAFVFLTFFEATEFEDEDLKDDFFHWAITPFLENQVSGQQTISKLQDVLYPETYDCELHAIDDNLVVGKMERQEIEPDFSYGLPEKTIIEEAKKNYPSIHPSQIELYRHIPDTPDMPDPQPYLVRVNSQILTYKSSDKQGAEFTIRELKTCQKISKLGAEVRTSRLYGIVQDERNPLIGLLFHYIEEEGTLDCVVDHETPEFRKVLWEKQIGETVEILHRAGIVWENAGAGNVVIDRRGDAWVVGFGDGYTRGWVSEKVGTVEGDLQGLARIKEFIFEVSSFEERD